MRRRQLTCVGKWLRFHKNRVQHIYQNIFLITEGEDNFITEDGADTFVTEESDL
jgi:hypothetical protein